MVRDIFYPIFHLPPTLNINQYVRLLEFMLINTLTAIGLDSFRIEGAPGIYTHQGKIASIGVRMSQKRCYHGVSLNVSCPLFPFSWLISCGDPNLTITSIAHHDRYPSMMCIKELMQENFFKLLLKE
jgi:lipoate-protein ligase B